MQDVKIGMFADLHIRPSDHKSFKDAWLAALVNLNRQGINFVTISGDVFDRYNIGTSAASVGTLVDSFCEPLSRLNMNALIIDGNHDMPNNNDMSALRIFNGMKNIIVVHNTKFVLKRKGNVAIMCLPWINNITQQMREDVIYDINECVNKLGATHRMVLLGHVEIEGTAINQNYKLFGTRYCWPAHIFEDLKSRGVMMALGHIHKADSNYLGAFRHLNFGDTDNVPGYYVYSSATHTKQFIENELSPKYMTIELGKNSIVFTSLLEKLNAKNFLKVRVHKDKLEEIKPLLKGNNIILEEIVEEQREKRVSVDIKGLDTMQLFKLYMESKGKDPKVYEETLKALVTKCG